MNSSDLTSVVITTYNRSDALLAVLDGLSRQDDTRFEVIVADDGSRPEHCQALLQSPVAQSLAMTHVWHPDVGFTASRIRNRGVAASRGDYIILLDGDCVPEADFIRQHRRLAERGCFVNGSRVLLSTQLTQAVVQGKTHLSRRGAPFWFHQRLVGQASKLTHLLRLPDGPFRRQTAFSWKGIRSCNMGVWRCDYEEIDGFDESFVGWGHEDADFVLRLHHAGRVRKNGFCATEVFHLWHPEADRGQESRNAQTVRAREQSGVCQATLGMSQGCANDDAVITRLG